LDGRSETKCNRKIDYTGLPATDASTAIAVKDTLSYVEQVLQSYSLAQRTGGGTQAPLLAMLIPEICTETLLSRMKFAHDSAITFATHQQWNDGAKFRNLLYEILLTEKGKRSVDPANIQRAVGESLVAVVYRLSQAQLTRDDLRKPEPATSATDKRHELLRALERFSPLDEVARLYMDQLACYLNKDDDALVDGYTQMEQAKAAQDARL
jgi:hypothetical protein